MESQFTLFAWLFSLAIIISFFWIMIQGFNNQLVIYNNKSDFLRVIITLISVLTLVGILNRTPADNPQTEIIMTWIATPIAIAASFILVMDNFILCVRQNNYRVLTGILIAIYRYFYILLALLLLIRIINGNNKGRTSGTVIQGIMGIVAIGYGIHRLINGDRVEKLRNNSTNDSSSRKKG